MHRFAALALSLAIPVAALAAPLLHVHPDEHATAHHRGATVHSHWSGHSGTPAAGHSHDAEHDGSGRWEASFAASRKLALQALMEQKTDVVLSIVLDRLYVRRNQLVHGGVANRQQVHDGAAI